MTTTTKTTKSATIEGVSDRLEPDRETLDRLAGLLPEEQLQDALNGLSAAEITGPGGLVTQLAGRVIETALGTELTEHLGYAPGQAPPGGAGNPSQWQHAEDGADRPGTGGDQYAAGPGWQV